MPSEVKSFVQICDLVLNNKFSCVLCISPNNEPDKAMLDLLNTIETNYKNIQFSVLQIEDIYAKSAAKQFGIKQLPCMMFFTAKSLEPIKTVIGYSPSQVHSVLKEVNEIEASELPNSKEMYTILCNFKKLMVFIKGIKEDPYCRFTKQLIALFDSIGVKDYGHYNIFENEQVRQGLKEFWDWPTYPQICINGNFVGGIDIINEMHSNGELIKELPSEVFQE
ncbi:glutaredoxin domain-containing protein [Cryptosporidium andersoni]|uniref:Glutaredoxin domain-containing protein n=1 Tax=Cryptosporidium andersoni TaxID=117008 RepID=A0A1J4MUI7_9CRYT|nr:glutaredoxin domain-containing protein [Cryptosporidium andersoni]